MLYIGIDGSTSSTGVGILNDKELIHYECIKPKASLDWQERVGIIAKRLNELFNEYQIEECYIEDVPLKDGKPTILKLGAVRGMAIFCCAIHNVPINPQKVSEWRKNANFYDGTRSGLTREQMKQKAIQEVKQLFNIDVNDDIAEGVLIGYYTKYPKIPKKSFGRR